MNDTKQIKLTYQYKRIFTFFRAQTRRAACLSFSVALAGLTPPHASARIVWQISDDDPIAAYESILADESINDIEKAAAISDLAAETGIYPTIYFDKFVPQNALDMVNQLPGFSLDEGQQARGFGGTAGNVLIDGARPTSKNGLRDTLRRIPAAQVERIEVLRGGIGASDAAGQTVVANIVRIPGASTGTATFTAVRDAAGRLRPRLSITYSTTLDGWETSSRLSVGTFTSPREALFENRDGDGTLTSSTREDRPEKGYFAFYTGEAGKDLFGGRLVLNTRFGFEGQNRDNAREIFQGRLPNDSPDSFAFIDDQNREQSFELGADWSRDTANNWKLRLLALTRFEFRQGESIFTEEDLNRDLTFLSDFTRGADTIETIFRTTYGKTGGAALRPEFGAEVAYNQLVSTFDLFEEDENGVIELDVPSSNVTVSEIRSEAFTNLVWNATKKLTVEGGLTWEISQIKVSGDAGNVQTFKFLKPTLSATYNARDNLQIQIQALRRIGQLNFGDFAASNDVSSDRVIAGNPSLSPDQTWRVSGNVNWRYSQRGSLTAEIFTEWRDDILEQILLPSGAAGLGNAGSARLNGLDLDGVIPLDFALKGGLIELNYSRRWSSFFDPVINADRPLSGINEEFFGFDFRQDLPDLKLAWGISRDGSFESPTFFVNEINLFRGRDRYNAFIETTRYLASKIRLSVERFTGDRFEQDRTFFDPDRGGTLTGTEVRRFRRGATVRLELTRQF